MGRDPAVRTNNRFFFVFVSRTPQTARQNIVRNVGRFFSLVQNKKKNRKFDFPTIKQLQTDRGNAFRRAQFIPFYISHRHNNGGF